MVKPIHFGGFTGRVAQVPRAVVWYKVYCYLFSALNYFSAWEAYRLTKDPYAVINTVGVLNQAARDQDTTEYFAFLIQAAGWSLFATGLIFGTIALSLPQAPDNKKTWAAHMVHIVFGAASCFLTPLCVPLLFAWFKPEVKAYFGVNKE